MISRLYFCVPFEFSLAMAACLFIDVFCGPSHEHLIKFVRQLTKEKERTTDFVTFPPKKWPWMARTGALQCLSKLPVDLNHYRTIFVTSTLNLSELIALRPQLQAAVKVIYFHENQLVYPVQKTENCDFQFGYNEVISALCADQVLFNSEYNLSSFLDAMPSFVGRIPGMAARSSAVADMLSKIRAKSQVFYLPLDFVGMDATAQLECSSAGDDNVCHILWSHRMEHDKDPETFFRVLLNLKNDDTKPVPFRVVVLGQNFSELPAEVNKAREALGDSVLFWGFLPDRKDYYRWIRRCHIVVSTAKHEFFGLSMLEAAYLGCYPVAPEKLSYPELMPSECLYRTEPQLRKHLAKLCRAGANRVRAKRAALSFDWSRFNWETHLSDKYAQICFR